jgi:NAD+-dependent protein deacetylase SIR2
MNFRCMDCRRRSRLEDVRKDVTSGSVVYCRSSSCGGILKPDITFFGEELPDAFFKAIKQDVSKCDLVIVIGW